MSDPKTASARKKTQENEQLLSLKELCSILSVSTATGRNWLRLGKIVPQDTEGNTARFSRTYACRLLESLKAGDNKALKSRRNKKYISGSGLYSSYVSEESAARDRVQEVLTLLAETGLTPGPAEIGCLLADCAVQLILHDEPLPPENGLEKYLKGELRLNGYEFLVDDLIDDKKQALEFLQKYPELFRITYPYEAGEDVLGLLYISTKNLGSRKVTGSYYTPTRVVKKLNQKLFEGADLIGKKLLDPCCGTGNFLLQLPSEVSFEQIYAVDTDSLSIKIARINLAIRYGVTDKELLCSHITCEDYLKRSSAARYDFILGNPPWGYAYSETEKTYFRRKYSAASGKSIESYDLFIEQALRDLAPGGMLAFVLPEALLSVKSHRPVRRLLSQNCSFRYLEYLGNVFDKVQCPSILFQVEKTAKPVSTVGMEVCDGRRTFTIGTERTVDAECFHFLSDDAEYALLKKIGDPAGKAFLKGNAVFALGIVTGGNRAFLSHEKREDNEGVLKGSDLKRFSYRPPTNYIVYRPDAFQQAAPTAVYRAPEKLLYRFISDRLVFAYDDRQTLSLNSCNLVIPQIEGLSVKYVLAVLNSSAAQYYFKKTFHSVKVLRSHIEKIPIPVLAEDRQEKVEDYVDYIRSAQDAKTAEEADATLDRYIAGLYGLTGEEFAIVRAGA